MTTNTKKKISEHSQKLHDKSFLWLVKNIYHHIFIAIDLNLTSDKISLLIGHMHIT
jgi:hypothetical protein